MKLFEWNYNDGRFSFGGVAKVWNGLNPVVFSCSNAFLNAFHRAYKGVSRKELGNIDMRFFSVRRVK